MAEKVKTADYREMDDEQLNHSLREMNKNLFHLRFQSATDRLETPSEIKKAKQQIARLRTILRERELGVRGQKSSAKPQGAESNG